MFRYLTALLLCVAAASATDFRSCDGGRPSADAVSVSGCDVMPCDFVRGTDLTSVIDFTTPIDADNMKPLVLVTILGLTIDYPLPNQDSCADLTGPGCPLSAGESTTYLLVMPIEPEYPLVSMTIEFSLLDQAGGTVVCIEMDGKVVDP